MDLGADEGTALLWFVNEPLRHSFLMNYSTSNHVLFNVLEAFYLEFLQVREIHFLLDHIYIVRALPAFFALCTLLYTFRLGKFFFDRTTALLSVVILATCIPFYNFSTLLRGYSLGTLLVTMLIYHAWRFGNERRPSFRSGFFVFLTVFLAVLTTPVNLYFISGIGIYYGIAVFAGEAGRLRPQKLLRRDGDTEGAPSVGEASRLYRRRLGIAGLILAGLVAAFAYYGSNIPYMIEEKPEWNAHGWFDWGILTVLIPKLLRYFLSHKWLLLPLAVLGLLAPAAAGGLRGRSAVILKRLFILGLLFILPFVPAFVLGTETLTRIFLNLAPVFALFFAGCISMTFRTFRLQRRTLSISILILAAYSHIVFAGCITDVRNQALDDIERSNWSQDIYYSYYFGHFRINSLTKEFAAARQPEIPVVILMKLIPFEGLDMKFYLEHAGIIAPLIDDLEPQLSRHRRLYVASPFENTFETLMEMEYPRAWWMKVNDDKNFYNIFLVGIDEQTSPAPLAEFSSSEG